MNFMQRIKGFTISYAQWAAAGFPKRDPEWVKELFVNHCKPCEYYNPHKVAPMGGVGTCTSCGCHVGNNDDPRNKLVLPNTSCPEGFWHGSIEERVKSDFMTRIRKQAREWRKNRDD